MIRSGNPALSDTAFQKGMERASSSESMTIQGTVNKTAIMLVLCCTTAWYTFQTPNMMWIYIGAIGGLITALITVFAKKAAPITAPLYALLEGLLLGSISAMYEQAYGGIVFQAISLTFAILFVMLFIYKAKIIEVTQNFKIAVASATGAIALIYLINFIMSFFGTSIPLIHSSGTFGILFSLVVIGIASMNLVMDFDFIEKASESGSTPKYMEWYGAFGLMVTLVWLYLELLRLLGKINRR